MFVQVRRAFAALILAVIAADTATILNVDAVLMRHVERGARVDPQTQNPVGTLVSGRCTDGVLVSLGKDGSIILVECSQVKS